MSTKSVLIISGTNRPNSNTAKVAKHYLRLMQKRNASVDFLSLEDLPADFAFTDMWVEKSATMKTIIEDQLEPATLYVFVMPEYNGGFPGVLKAFIDCVPPPIFKGKKAALVGVASGKAGALRPMDQFTNVLNYLKVSVLYHKPKLSEINQLLNSEGELVDERALAMLDEHADLALAF